MSMLMRDAQAEPVAIRREDYRAPAYWIDTVDLTFDLDPAKTRVLNRMRLRRNPEVAPEPLRLDGDELNLARVLVDGQGASFRMEADQLVIDNLPDAFELELFTTCAPAKNTKLMGLFVSEDTFFTQCEAEGFRRITYFLDRPDVMASYTVTIRAAKAATPSCCRTETWSSRANCPRAAISPNGSIPSASPATCSRWWPASSWRASSASRPATARSTCCRSMCVPATSTRPSTR